VRTAAATLVRIPRLVPRAISLGPHGRRRLIAVALLAVALGAGYLFWFRDSGFVKVEKVTVSGLTGSPDAARVRAKLANAAEQMTTLHLDVAALERSVADEPVVQSLSVTADFPHGLRIHIVENRPVAVLVANGRQVAVAPDGTVLPSVKDFGGLPTVDVGAVPLRGRMPDGPARERVAVAASAPPRLLARVDTIEIQHGRGAVAELRNGPVIIFGRPNQLGSKWAAAAAVLAQRSSQGATYIDVRMPGRPVAGGLGLEQDPQPQADGLVPATPTGSLTTGDPTAAGPATTAPTTTDPATAAPATGTAPTQGTSTSTTVPPTASTTTSAAPTQSQP
jgi:cell division protein FtsQ